MLRGYGFRENLGSDFDVSLDYTTDSEYTFLNPYQLFKLQLVRVQPLDSIQLTRSKPIVKREGCTTQLKIVIEGANSREFGKRKAALRALDKLKENNYTSALIFVMNDFSESDDTFKEFLARKAKEYLQQ
jgi:hypothetical protein